MGWDLETGELCVNVLLVLVTRVKSWWCWDWNAALPRSHTWSPHWWWWWGCARTHTRTSTHGQAHTDARRHTQDGHDYTAARFSHWSRALYGEVQVRAAHICNNKSIRRRRWSGCAYLWDAVLGVESRPVWHNTKSLSLLNLFLLAPSCRWWWLS